MFTDFGYVLFQKLTSRHKTLAHGDFWSGSSFAFDGRCEPVHDGGDEFGASSEDDDVQSAVSDSAIEGSGRVVQRQVAGDAWVEKHLRVRCACLSAIAYAGRGALCHGQYGPKV